MAVLDSAFVGLTDSQIAVQMAITVQIPIPNAFYSAVGVGEALALAGVDQSILLNIPAFLNTLIGGPTLIWLLNATSMPDFSLASIQAPLAANAAEFAGNAVTLLAIQTMIGLGQKSLPTWQAMGLGAQPSSGDVTAAKARNTAQAYAASLWNEIVLPLVALGNSPAAIKAAIAASS